MLALSAVQQIALVGALLAALFVPISWRKREQPGGMSLTAFFCLISGSNLAYSLDLLATTVETKVALATLSVCLGTLGSLAWLLTALVKSGRGHWFSRRIVGAGAAISIAYMSLLFVPALQQYVATVPDAVGPGPLMRSGYEPGVLVIILFLFTFASVIVATFVYLQLFLRVRYLYRTRSIAMLGAATVPWYGFLIQLFGFFPNYDLSGTFLALGGVVLTIGQYRFKTLDLVPAAHESVVSAMGNGVIIVDADGMVNDVNESARSLLGSTDEQSLIASDISNVIPSWDELSVPTDGSSDWQQQSLTVDGAQQHLEIRTAPIDDYHDNPVGHLIELRDVTKREYRERSLSRFRTIFESVDDPVYVLDSSGQVVMVNDAFAALVERNRAALYGEQFGALLADRTESTFVPDTQIDLQLERPDGDEIPIETTQRTIDTSFEGIDGGVVGVVRDISERRRVEAELSITSGRYDTLADAAPLAILAINAGGIVERWNPAAEELFGWSASEAIGEPLSAIPKDSASDIERAVSRVLEDEQRIDVETVLERRDGERFDAAISLAPVVDDSGARHGAVIVVSDITARMERVRTLEQQNDRLDEFASIVSHDLRNPLNIASGKVELARQTGELDHLDSVTDAHERMSDLIDNLLTLTRDGQQLETTEPVDLNSSVMDAWKMVPTGDLALEKRDALGTVTGDPTRLRSLFENLFRNADEHAGAGATVTVGSLPDREGFYVADDGPGIPESDREQIFDSGYSTNEAGTGFGLAIVETIAESHGWSISLTESETGGARFEFETGPFGERRGTDVADDGTLVARSGGGR